MTEQEKVPFCVDCKYCSQDIYPFVAECSYPETIEKGYDFLDVVTGVKSFIPSRMPDCGTSRTMGKCSHEAKFFEPKI